MNRSEFRLSNLYGLDCSNPPAPPNKRLNSTLRVRPKSVLDVERQNGFPPSSVSDECPKRPGRRSPIEPLNSSTRDGAMIAYPPSTLRAPMKMLTRTSAFAIVLAASVVIARPMAAQNNITQQKVGDFVYYGGTYDGKPVSGTAQRVGTTMYYNLTVGGVQKNWTEQVVGQTTYRSGPDGLSGSSQRIGNQTYSQSSSGISYTEQKIGNFIYVTGSNGCRSTIQIIGNQRYASGTC